MPAWSPVAEKPLAESPTGAAPLQTFDVEVDSVSFAYEDEDVFDKGRVEIDLSTFQEGSRLPLPGG